mgnify:CR=1 FL=1
MKKLLVVLVLGLILSSCEKEPLEKPLEVNSYNTSYEQGDAVLTVVTFKGFENIIHMNNNVSLPLLGIDDTSSSSFIYNKYLLREGEKVDVKASENVKVIFRCSRHEYISKDSLVALVIVEPCYNGYSNGVTSWCVVENYGWSDDSIYNESIYSPLVLGCTYKNKPIYTLKDVELVKISDWVDLYPTLH